MVRGKAEDAGGRTPAKDGSAALCPFCPPNFTGFQVCRLYCTKPGSFPKNGQITAAAPRTQKLPGAQRTR